MSDTNFPAYYYGIDERLKHIIIKKTGSVLFCLGKVAEATRPPTPETTNAPYTISDTHLQTLKDLTDVERAIIEPLGIKTHM